LKARFRDNKLSRKSYLTFGMIKGYRGILKMLHSLKKFDISEVAQQKLKIIKFFDEFGEKATKEAFGADRKLISRWKKRLNNSGGDISSLVPKSTKPHITRKPDTNPLIKEFIRELRMKYPTLGKEKIKPLLNQYCNENNMETVSESTIGNIIKRNNYNFKKTGRIYHNPQYNYKKRTYRTKVKNSPKEYDTGYIMADTVEKIIDGVKDYFYSAIDIKNKFSLTLNYKKQNSKNMTDFYKRFKTVYPCKIKYWQNDNGSENLGDFQRILKNDGIPQLFSYPRCPRINAFIERYNRTIQEEFIDNYIDIIHDKPLFNQKLAEYNIFFNTKRVHKSLSNKTPMDYIIEKGGMSQKSLTYT
jgi:hypothetical protein